MDDYRRLHVADLAEVQGKFGGASCGPGRDIKGSRYWPHEQRSHR